MFHNVFISDKFTAMITRNIHNIVKLFVEFLVTGLKITVLKGNNKTCDLILIPALIGISYTKYRIRLSNIYPCMVTAKTPSLR